MSLWSKLAGGQTPATSPTARDRARRAKENRAIDTRTAAWLRAGGLAPKRK